MKNKQIKIMEKSRKLSFNYDLSNLPVYNTYGSDMLIKSILGLTLPKYATIRPNLKGTTEKVGFVTNNVILQDLSCGFDPTGATTQNLVTVDLCNKKVNQQLCPYELYDTYLSQSLTNANFQESVPFEQQIADLKVKQIQQRIEQQLWQNTTAGGGCFNGFALLISQSTGNTYASAVASSSGTTFSSSAAYGSAGNPITEVDKLINVLDDNAMSRDDLRVFMSYANFRLYVQALTRANFFQNYIGSTDVTGMMEAIHPNTNVKVIPTIGLNGSAQVTIGPAEYMVVGFDLLSDHEKLTIWYSKDFDELRLRANYNYGATIATFGTTKYFATNGL